MAIVENLDLRPVSIVADKAAQVFEADEFNKKLIQFCAEKINNAADIGHFSCGIVLSTAINIDSDETQKLAKAMGDLTDYLRYAGYTVDGCDLSTRTIRVSWSTVNLNFGA